MDNIKESIIHYYLKTKQVGVICYRLFWIYVFNVQEITAYSNGQKINVTWKYFIFNILTFIIQKFTALRNRIDIAAEKVHMTKITNDGDKTVILDHSSMPGQAMITLETVNNELHDLRSDNTLVNCVFINFDLVNNNGDDDNNRICLKEYAIKYKDTTENHPHTLKNILVFNNVPYSDDSKILVKAVKNRKISTYELPLKDVRDKHINYFINL